jgi:hypothetical protein
VEDVALALLEIHQRRLYRQGYGSFKVYLAERWHMSRARGYQLLHFAKLKQTPAVVAAAAPQNERQARRLTASGKPRLQKDDDPIAQAMEYVTDALERRPACEKSEFIYWLRLQLSLLEGDLERKGVIKGDPIEFYV